MVYIYILNNIFDSNDVYIIGNLTQNNKIKLCKINYTTLLVEPNGIYSFSYIVDGIKRIDSTQPIYINENGESNNFLIMKNAIYDIEYLQIAEKAGNINALIELGKYYRKTKQYDIMKKYFIKAIEKNSAYAMHEFAYYFYTQQNYELMHKYYKMAIDNNYVYSMCLLSEYYYNINNYDKVVELLELACKQNHPYAFYCYGNFLYKTQNNIDLAKIYLEHTANNNNADAMRSLIVIYMKSGSESEKISYWMDKFIKNTDHCKNNKGEFIHNVAHYYKNINIDLYIKYLYYAIEYEYGYAAYELALYYESISDIKKQRELLTRGLELGNAYSACALATLNLTENPYKKYDTYT